MENIKIKQNQNKAVIMIAVFMFGLASWLFAFPSYAYTDNSTNNIDYSEQPIGHGDNNSSPNATNFENGTTIYSNSGSSGKVYYFGNEADVYFFLYDYNSSNYHGVFVSETYNVGCRYIYYNGSAYYFPENVKYTSNSNNTYNLYYSPDIVIAKDNNVTVPVFSSSTDGLASVKDWIDNPPASPATGHRFAGSLAPGQVAVFDVGGLSDFNIVLGTTLFSGYKYSGYSTTQAAGMTSSMPTSITLPLSYTSSINWRGSGQKNLIGQYSNFSFTEHVTSTFSSQYYVVVNPLSGTAPSNTALDSSSSNRNNNITILIDKVKSYKTFSLTESVSISENGWSEDTSSNGDTTTGTYDEDANAWVGVNDQTNRPENFNDLPVGGGNSPLIGGSNSINDFLQDIANTIKGFFSGAIGAVSTLVSAGSAFINQLIGLYSWLPAPVYSVLSAALIIVITIGVIKVFV